MQVDIGSYYVVGTQYGDKVIKAIEYDSENIPYGVFSISDFVFPYDGQGMQIVDPIRTATNEEQEDWNNWYNQQ